MFIDVCTQHTCPTARILRISSALLNRDQHFHDDDDDDDDAADDDDEDADENDHEDYDDDDDGGGGDDADDDDDEDDEFYDDEYDDDDNKTVSEIRSEPPMQRSCLVVPCGTSPSVPLCACRHQVRRI